MGALSHKSSNRFHLLPVTLSSYSSHGQVKMKHKKVSGWHLLCLSWFPYAGDRVHFKCEMVLSNILWITSLTKYCWPGTSLPQGTKFRLMHLKMPAWDLSQGSKESSYILRIYGQLTSSLHAKQVLWNQFASDHVNWFYFKTSVWNLWPSTQEKFPNNSKVTEWHPCDLIFISRSHWRLFLEPALISSATTAI